MTAHINAKKKDISKKVLMPGDPLRAKWIAENFLENAKLVNSIRNMIAYTGYYKGEKITIFPHGMGLPSIGIYVHELFQIYDVNTIYRLGSGGSINKDIKINDLILAKSAWTNSTFSLNYNNGELTNLAFPSESSYNNILNTAKQLNMKIFESKIISADVFYSKWTPDESRKISGGADILEMEAFALFIISKKFNKNSACLLTVSDSLITNEELDHLERQTTFKNMVKLALESIIKE